MTDDEKIKLVATMAANIYANTTFNKEDVLDKSIYLLEETIKTLKEKGMIKDE